MMERLPRVDAVCYHSSQPFPNRWLLLNEVSFVDDTSSRPPVVRRTPVLLSAATLNGDVVRGHYLPLVRNTKP